MSETVEQRDVRREFEDLVNMAPKELEELLATDESKEVRRTRVTELGEDDYAHMRKVTGYIKPHTKHGPPQKSDTETSGWRYSLMNLGPRSVAVSAFSD